MYIWHIILPKFFSLDLSMCQLVKKNSMPYGKFCRRDNLRAEKDMRSVLLNLININVGRIFIPQAYCEDRGAPWPYY